MYRRVPTSLEPLLKSGRLLVISTTLSPRQSRATAFARNKYICELADDILFVGADENSSLHPLRVAYSGKAIVW
jgi:predicted Rossmann fold nucleotide-binding protein DprA/Smf involved in DNA uptake